jgi:hypothetical protein
VRRSFFVACATTIAVIAACSSFEDGNNASSTVEAGTDAGDGGSSSTNDATTATPFCKVDGGTFCADFDDPGAAGFGGFTRIDDGGAVFEDDAAPASPPNAMRFKLARQVPSDLPDGGCAYALVRTADLDIPTSGLGAEFKLKVHTPPVTGRLSLGPSIQFTDATLSRRCDVFLGIAAGGAAHLLFDTDGTTGSAALSRKPIAGQWSHVELDVHGGVASRAVTVRVDGEIAATDVLLPTDCQASTIFRGIGLGLFCVDDGVGGDVDVSYDDIRVITR